MTHKARSSWRRRVALALPLAVAMTVGAVQRGPGGTGGTGGT